MSYYWRWWQQSAQGDVDMASYALKWTADGSQTAGQYEVVRTSGSLAYNVPTGVDYLYSENGTTILKLTTPIGGPELQLITLSDDSPMFVADGATGRVSGFLMRENGSFRYQLAYEGSSNYVRLMSWDTDGSQTVADVFRIPDAQLTIDANSTWDANVFDEYDDVALIEASISPTAEAYDFGKGLLLKGQQALIKVGVLREYPDGFIGYNDQRMAALLAGGLYQTRRRLDEQYKELDRRLLAIGA